MEAVVQKLGLPRGYAFAPKDEEVVASYLLPRLQGQRLPVDGVILEDDPLSAPPWELLKKHGRKRDAFFFAAGQQATNGKGSRQKRRCACGGTWDGQKKVRGGRDGEKLRVPGSGGVEVAWQKYALSFQEDGEEGSSGWVMHEYAIIAPPKLAASPLRLYRIRFSGHGKNAKKRKRDAEDSDSGGDDDDDAEVAHAEIRPAVAENALFVGECPAALKPEPVSSAPVVMEDGNPVDGEDVGEGSAVFPAAPPLSDQDLNEFMFSLEDLSPGSFFLP